MEQFKQLKWSWHKYEEDKKYLPRNFNFETINDNDALSRNLNEIHTCAIPKQDEYRIFKTPEEIESNFCESNNLDFVELKDPREFKFSKLETSREIIKEYSYPSELRRHEHVIILRNLIDDTIYNPKCLQKSMTFENKSNIQISKELKDKWQKESNKFNRCAEIYYHRHITQFNNVVCNKFKEILFDKWKRLEGQFPFLKYQAITMIVRNLSTKPASITSIKHIEDLPKDYQPEFYKINEEFFPNIKDVCVNSIQLFSHFKDIFYEDNKNLKADIHISLNVLSKLFVDGTEFNTLVMKESNATKFVLNEAIPLKTVNQSDALEEAIKLIIQFNIEWQNASKTVEMKNTEKIDFKPRTINETMSKIFKRYKENAGANNEISFWRLEKNSLKLLISVSNSSYYINDETRVIPSIKFEYQTNFGAEQMTREELLNEWIQIKFSSNTIIMRYRISVKSMEILSVLKLKIEDIEEELRNIYNYDPMDAMDILFNFFHCIHNLPESRYIIQGQRNDKECNKLVVFKDVAENGKIVINDEEFNITESFTRKWIPIDKVVTFLHLNEEIAPCCFSYKSIKRFHSSPNIKPVPKKKAVKHKSPQKPNIQKKRSKRKKNKTAFKKT